VPAVVRKPAKVTRKVDGIPETPEAGSIAGKCVCEWSCMQPRSSAGVKVRENHYISR
jgi:hypothetical protein